MKFQKLAALYTIHTYDSEGNFTGNVIYYPGAYDTLRFESGIVSSDVRFVDTSSQGLNGSLIISVDGVDIAYIDSASKNPVIEKIVFADNQEMSLVNFTAGTVGDDVLNGGIEDDILDGSQGDDIVSGGAGDDTLIFAYGESGTNGDHYDGGADDDKLLIKLSETQANDALILADIQTFENNIAGLRDHRIFLLNTESLRPRL